MPIYMVTYDLRTPGQQYDDLYGRIKQYAAWCHALESVWFVASKGTATQVRDELLRLIDSNDGLVVTSITKGNSAWTGLTDEIGKWLKDNL